VIIIDHDPGDEHREPWPFTCGPVFDVGASDDLAITWIAKTPLKDGWYTAVCGLDRRTMRTTIVQREGRVEDITEMLEELCRRTAENG
jgi:hypothetical protein